MMRTRKGQSALEFITTHGSVRAHRNRRGYPLRETLYTASHETTRLRPKKGQAALEFLTTYGWAFIILLVMIGALSYFGVLNMNTFIPERCQFDEAFSCSDYVYESSNPVPVVRVNLLNAYGKSIRIVNATITCSGTGGTCEVCQAAEWCRLNRTLDGEDATFWLSGDARTLTFNVNGGSTADLLKTQVVINYIPANQYFIQTSKGNIFIKG